MSTPQADKRALRAQVLARRDALSEDERTEASRRITASLLAHPAVLQARRALVYLSFGSEFDTSRLIDALRARAVALVLPRTQREPRGLALHEVSDLDADLAPGVWGIREPRPERCPLVARESLDLVLAPGVAFTPRGGRLGYGGGFYDRLLGDWPQRPAVLAAAFEVQVVDELPIVAHDVPVDGVVTEARVLARA
ncbi:MAG: 5-formyltetrahydrofolate cyclo-ligase [Burkholderiales bacterium]|nr:5-formyltetrahydrofolate cyclo-ligase [Burkholderiales bacterium]